MTNENDIARPDDFKRAAEARKVKGQVAERVVLPQSGYSVLLRRPTPMWFLFHGYLPMSLAAKRQGRSGGGNGSEGTGIETAEEFVEFSKWIVELLGEVFVAPKLSLAPGVDEISPEWLAEEDVNFIMRWAVGEVVDDGSGASGHHDLAQFRGAAAGARSAARAGGGDVSLPPEPVAQGDGDGPAD